MRLAVRAGIDDRDLPLAHDIAQRAGKGERARIVAEHAADAGYHLLDDTGLQGKVTVERDVVVIGHFCFLTPLNHLRFMPRLSRPKDGVASARLWAGHRRLRVWRQRRGWGGGGTRAPRKWCSRTRCA